MPPEAHSPPVEINEAADDTADMSIGDVLSADNLDKFREAPLESASEEAEEAPAEKPKTGKAKPAKGKKSKLAAASEDGPGEGEEGPGDEKTPEEEDTKPDGERPEPNEEAEEKAFSDEALSTPEGVKAAREIVRAAREQAEKRNHILDRYDTRIKRKHEKAQALHTEATALRDQTINIRGLISRDIQILGAAGTTAKEKLEALGRLGGGRRPAHEIYDELTAGILSDGKQGPKDPAFQALERQNAELRQMIEGLAQGQKNKEAEQEQRANQAQIQQVYTAIQAAAEDAETYPEIASGLESEDWSPEEVSEMVAGPEGIMVKHYRRTGERLDKLEALGILEARLAKRAGRAAKAETGAGPAKKPGSPTRGVGRGTTISPSVADRSAGSRRELNSREERIGDLARDRAALEASGLGAFLS